MTRWEDMEPERQREVERVFIEAIERPAEERAAFVAKACAGDPELHEEVLSLLEADAAAEKWFPDLETGDLMQYFLAWRRAQEQHDAESSREGE